MKSKMTEMLLIIFALFVYVQPASGAATDEVWIPKISGGFFYIQRDSPVRVQFTRNGEKEEATGRITNLNSDKEFKNNNGLKKHFNITVHSILIQYSKI